MLTGTGSVALRSGRRLPAKYQFGTHEEHHWVGYLICDTQIVDPSEFSCKILLQCESGIAIELAVTDWMDRYMVVVGRPLPEFDRVA
ncbi:MAG: hypothetical protein ACTHP8_23780 [Bosea sp. (in: a-proteobacteria)]|uniref:hypothetical protein n=1 Tax=Bosea sp. (in: a-proteobacteria) TaxID=1871050 RepID=UPI003F7BF72D